MIDELLIPREVLISEPILEKIRSDGRQETQRDWEAVGLLSGSYNPSSHQISVSRIYNLYSQSGKPTRTITVHDFFVKLLQLPRIIWGLKESAAYSQNLRKRSIVPADLLYHTHPFGSWSQDDMLFAEKEIKALARCGTAGAFLLYKTLENQFEAIDGRLKSIPIST